MSPPDTRNLLQALGNADYRYLGIRPSDATPKEAPCVQLDGRNANDLSYALVTAGEFWPECQDWNLIGSDETLQLTGEDWPPNMRAFRQPAVLAGFSTTA